MKQKIYGAQRSEQQQADLPTSEHTPCFAFPGPQLMLLAMRCLGAEGKRDGGAGRCFPAKEARRATGTGARASSSGPTQRAAPRHLPPPARPRRAPRPGTLARRSSSARSQCMAPAGRPHGPARPRAAPHLPAPPRPGPPRSRPRRVRSCRKAPAGAARAPQRRQRGLAPAVYPWGSVGWEPGRGRFQTTALSPPRPRYCRVDGSVVTL